MSRRHQQALFHIRGAPDEVAQKLRHLASELAADEITIAVSMRGDDAFVFSCDPAEDRKRERPRDLKRRE